MTEYVLPILLIVLNVLLIIEPFIYGEPPGWDSA